MKCDNSNKDENKSLSVNNVRRRLEAQCPKCDNSNKDEDKSLTTPQHFIFFKAELNN